VTTNNDMVSRSSIDRLVAFLNRFAEASSTSFQPGDYVEANVPVCRNGEHGWAPVSPARVAPRVCVVESGPGRHGRFLVRVKNSQKDEEGNPHRVFLRASEMKPYVAGEKGTMAEVAA
jgi:hypothetical protein